MTNMAVGQKWLFENLNGTLGPSTYEVIYHKEGVFKLKKLSGSNWYFTDWYLTKDDINHISENHRFYPLKTPEPFTDDEYSQYFV